MSSGDLYYALSRNQNLQPTVDAIKNIVQGIRRKDAISQIAEAKKQMDALKNSPDNFDLGGNSIIPGGANIPLGDVKYKQAQGIANDALFSGLDSGLDKPT